MIRIYSVHRQRAAWCVKRVATARWWTLLSSEEAGKIEQKKMMCNGQANRVLHTVVATPFASDRLTAPTNVDICLSFFSHSTGKLLQRRAVWRDALRGQGRRREYGRHGKPDGHVDQQRGHRIRVSRGILSRHAL